MTIELTCGNCGKKGHGAMQCNTSAADAGYKFRLLTNSDTIEKGDEFLSDDCKTWIPANEQIMAGRGIRYDLYRDMPMRRKL